MNKLFNLVKQVVIDLDLDYFSRKVEVDGILDYVVSELETLNTQAYDVEIVKQALAPTLVEFQLFQSEEFHNTKVDSNSELDELEEEDKEDLFFRTLCQRLLDTQTFGELTEEVDEEELNLKYTCAMCQRLTPLTFHHLIPKQCHSQLLKKKMFSKSFMNTNGIDICKLCHSAIHRLFSNKQLALELNSLDKLLKQDKIQKWLGFARKQKVRIKNFNPNFR